MFPVVRQCVGEILPDEQAACSECDGNKTAWRRFYRTDSKHDHPFASLHVQTIVQNCYAEFAKEARESKHVCTEPVLYKPE